MKFCILLGTRPEIIKAGPIINYCGKKGIDYFVLHTGQHYAFEMDNIFFRDLKLPQPKYNLQIGSGSHGAQTGLMLQKIEDILVKEKPDIVLVVGDTNSVLAGAMAASKLRIKVGHVEAGLRSYDRDMAEEQNRVVTDHLSDFLFAPTEEAAANLYNEGIQREKVFVVGNTIVDAVIQNLKIAEEYSDVPKSLGVEKGKYILATIHRPENVDNDVRLNNILLGLNKIYRHTKMPVILPAHPRTKKKLDEFGIMVHNGISLVEPKGYLEFLQLMNHSHLTITDSGGIQEETSVLKVPCVTVRENTERTETIKIGSNKLAGLHPDNILKCAIEMMNSSRNWETPYGDGNAAGKIIDVVMEVLK